MLTVSVRTRAVVVAGVSAAALAVTAAAWACVAGIALRIDRVLVAPGGELEVDITVVGSPDPKPIALRLDRLDAPPLAVVTPSATGSTVVRIEVPPAAGDGQHILIANDARPPARGEHGYLTTRALFSVVDARVAAGNPGVETEIDFAPSVPYDAFMSQFGTMGADVVRLRYTGRTSGEFVNRSTGALSSVSAAFQQHVGGIATGRWVIDGVTVKGQVELATLGPLAAQVAARRVVGLPAPPAAPTAAAAAADGRHEGLPGAPVALAGVLLVAVAAGAAGVRARAGR